MAGGLNDFEAFSSDSLRKITKMGQPVNCGVGCPSMVQDGRAAGVSFAPNVF